MNDPRLVEKLLGAYDPDEDPAAAQVLCDYFLERGDRALAASAFDRAYGLNPANEGVARERAALLDGFARVEHGVRFRYVPAGSFLMGSERGDPDERPVHPARVAGFWISETPISWATWCSLMDWEPPPHARPREEMDRDRAFSIHEQNKIRRQYCEDQTTRAADWHSHGQDAIFEGEERVANVPHAYDVKPMVAVSIAEIDALSARCPGWRLPTEAEWEKAARGGLIGKRWSWGDEPPDPSRCDFDRFAEFAIAAPRSLPPNGYGLYGMCGGVSEWTSDPYDALAYASGVATAGTQRVLRGGSWADCADAVTVSFRMSRDVKPRAHGWGEHLSPTIGFRICLGRGP